MNMEDIAFLDATEQAALVRRGDISSVELVAATIERIVRFNPRLNAVITPLYEQARQAAASVQADAPFAGVPFLLKDLVADLAGTPRSDGSAFVAGHYIATTDSVLTHRFKQAGFIVIGKSNTSEFGLLPTTEPDRFGPTRNPWDLDRGSGGSSGGSAAAVAAGLVPAGHASDGGGSIRIPSSCCGVVGFKPTRGRNSYAPDLGDVAGGILCDHAVTRSVRDSAAILDATAGPLPGDPHIAPAPVGPYAQETDRDPGCLRIGLGTVALTGETAHQDCVNAVMDTASLCEGMGHDVEVASPGLDSGLLFKSFGKVMTGYLNWSIRKWALQTGRDPVEEEFETVTWRMYQHGLGQTAGEYLLAWQNLQKCCRQFAAFFNDYDIWLTPTLVKPPVPLGYFSYSHETRMQHIERLGHFTGFTMISNASGHPAVSLPLYWNADSLPIGVQLTGRFGDEAGLFRLAGQLERAQPWAHRRPPL